MISPEHQASLDLLAKAADQFRFYEHSHNQKARQMEPVFAHERNAYENALEKAQVNAALAREIEDHIANTEECYG